MKAARHNRNWTLTGGLLEAGQQRPQDHGQHAELQRGRAAGVARPQHCNYDMVLRLIW